MGKVNVHRPRIQLFFLLILGFVPLYPLQADLDAFKDRIETIEKIEQDKAADQTPSSEESRSSEEGDRFFGAFLFNLLDLLGGLWLYNNT
ncbi:hypothetical protein Holit_01708 [Hollandina sp. SP2]